MVQVLHIRVQGAGAHESQISDVRWYDPKSGSVNVATAAAMVKFIDQDRGRAYIFNGQHVAELEVVPGAPAYIRAKPGGAMNLLSVPRF